MGARYDGLAQFLANRGYAVLLPNFRGSSGYGKNFMDAGNQGIADPERIRILGGSYGGYAVLAARSPNRRFLTK